MPKIGLRSLVLSDGPNGVRGTAWDERDPSLLFPVASAGVCTWCWRRRSTCTEVLSGAGIQLRRGGRRAGAARDLPQAVRADRGEGFAVGDDGRLQLGERAHDD
ncbi:hypothetical protein [Saccharopolyspora spinosa]|uniref:hypothetical protein n=1 Tax=Saccharopolyspora spinosa TaxID=60894 RepID=UPI00031050EA|nr:hypothetical protein [Saccharopolyspora spinosa]